MAGKRYSPSNSQLGNSWVVEESYTPKRRSNRLRSVEPEFIMPSPDGESLDGSWVKPSEKSLHKEYRESGSPRPRKSKSIPTVRAPPQGESDGTSSDEAPKPRQRRSKPTGRNRSYMDSSDGTSRAQSRDTRNRTREQPHSSLLPVLRRLSAEVLDICGGALRFIKAPISWFLGMAMLGFLAITLMNYVSRTLTASLSPICALPGVSLLRLPFCESVAGQGLLPSAAGPVEFDAVMGYQTMFGDILEQSSKEVTLPLDMKKSEASIRDLRQVVRYSDLRSRHELELEFDGFIETARMASYDLQTFNSHVGRAVYHVLSITRYTTRVLEDIQLRDTTKGIFEKAFHSLLGPLRPKHLTEKALLDQYLSHTSSVEEQINRLIEEAQALLLVLQNLDDRLDVIHGISTRDDAHIKASKEEILQELWTFLGSNRGKLKKLDRQSQLLEDVTRYRKTAWAHVSGTILKLQAMGAGLEDLRERVGSAGVLPNRMQIPLSVHLENINLGIERLEDGKRNAQRLENEYLRRVLDKGQLDKRVIDIVSETAE